MLIDKLESKEYKHIVKDKTNKNYINDVLKKNPDFVFYDYDNECVGDDLIKLIKEVEKKSYEKGYCLTCDKETQPVMKCECEWRNKNYISECLGV